MSGSESDHAGIGNVDHLGIESRCVFAQVGQGSGGTGTEIVDWLRRTNAIGKGDRPGAGRANWQDMF